MSSIWSVDILVSKMNKHIELPLIEPIYKTYHYQGSATAIIGNNPTIKNWYMNQVMNLTCGRRFLYGYTTPEITIAKSYWSSNPYLEKKRITKQSIDGVVDLAIKEMLSRGYYIYFSGVDDYYVQGKSWYGERHFSHDGLICGYDQEEVSYCIYAHDINWVYQKFWTPQKGFYAGRAAMEGKGVYGKVYALKAKDEFVEFSPDVAFTKLREYLNSNNEIYPFEGEDRVYGIVVHDYIAEYISRLYNREIPYDRMDRRVFRVIWEHKKAMLERISLIEKSLDMDSTVSEQYSFLVSEADMMRMLYASHYMKRRDSVLPVIKKKLLALKEKEQELLTGLVEKMGEGIKSETVEVS